MTWLTGCRRALTAYDVCSTLAVSKRLVTEEIKMPEAVVVSTGTLAVQMVEAVLEKVLERLS